VPCSQYSVEVRSAVVRVLLLPPALRISSVIFAPQAGDAMAVLKFLCCTRDRCWPCRHSAIRWWLLAARRGYCARCAIRWSWGAHVLGHARVWAVASPDCPPEAGQVAASSWLGILLYRGMQCRNTSHSLLETLCVVRNPALCGARRPDLLPRWNAGNRLPKGF
jgi:hypothetical protein